VRTDGGGQVTALSPIGCCALALNVPRRFDTGSVPLGRALRGATHVLIVATLALNHLKFQQFFNFCLLNFQARPASNPSECPRHSPLPPGAV